MFKNPQLEPLELDTAQWSRDIATFMEVTKAELNEITEELSGQFAGRAPQDSNPRSETTSIQKSDDRLAKLKQKLALRTNQ